MALGRCKLIGFEAACVTRMEEPEGFLEEMSPKNHSFTVEEKRNREEFDGAAAVSQAMHS